ncbi:hypothetical protein FCV25MIE_09751 [Fagus crenata]
MGGTRHVFIESKAFELTFDHGGGAHVVRLYERGKDTLRSIFMGMKSAKTLLDALEELVSLKHTGDFVRTIRKGETVFIAQRCNNAKGRFVTIQAIHRGGRRGSIIIPEGRNSNGWRGFALELRRILFPESPPNQQSKARERVAKPAGVLGKSFVVAASGSGNAHGGGSVKGKEIFLEGIPKSREHSKQNLNLKINMATSEREKRDLGKVNISINLELICGPNGDWSVQKACIGDNPVYREPIKSDIQIKVGNGPNEASTSSHPPKPKHYTSKPTV